MFRRSAMMAPGRAGESCRAPSTEQEDGLRRAVDRPMTAAARQSLPGGLRPSSVPIDSDAAGGLSPRSESRSLAGDRRPSTFPVKSEVRAAENVAEPEPDDEMPRISNGRASGSGQHPPPSPPPTTPIEHL